MTETLPLVEQHIIRRDDARWQAIDAASFAAKNIYNAANYRLRQAYLRDGQYIPFVELDKCFKQQNLLPDQQLPSKVVQQVLRQLDHDWQSYFAALEAWQMQPEKFTGRPRLPSYKHKSQGRNVLIYPEQAYFKKALEKGFIKLSRLDIVIPTRQWNIDQVRIVPHKTHYTVEVVYSKAIEPVPHLNPAWTAGADLGVDTLLALTSDKPGFIPLLVNGRGLKAINQGYNQHRADLQGRLPAGQYTSRQLAAITDKRNRRIKTDLHRCSRAIIDHLVSEGIGTLVIGKNVGWKQAVKLGNRTNQTFVAIPHAQFIEMLSYKARLVGIRVVVSEESYTSKCSFLDLEPVGQHERYMGKRVQRGLFRASDGRTIQADVNAAYNLIRKVVPKAFADGIGAAVVQPVRVYPRAN
jgi:putative transposase